MATYKDRWWNGSKPRFPKKINLLRENTCYFDVIISFIFCSYFPLNAARESGMQDGLLSKIGQKSFINWIY